MRDIIKYLFYCITCYNAHWHDFNQLHIHNEPIHITILPTTMIQLWYKNYFYLANRVPNYLFQTQFVSTLYLQFLTPQKNTSSNIQINDIKWPTYKESYHGPKFFKINSLYPQHDQHDVKRYKTLVSNFSTLIGWFDIKRI